MAARLAVQLGEVLAKSDNWIVLQPETEYKEVTVRLWGKGLALRGKKLGSEFGSDRRLRIKSGQFIVSRIDARHGAFGIAPEELDGAVVSNDFPAYVLDTDQIRPDYLHWLSKTHGFVEACKRSSEGTTNRVRLKEDRFKRITINLPSLDEQKHIVDKVGLLSSKANQANRLRTEIQTDCKALLRSALSELIAGAPYRPMAKVAPIVRRKVDIEIDGEYPELGVRSFGRGIFHKPTLIGAELDWQKLFRIYQVDLVISNIKAWEGAIAVAGEEDHRRVGSHRYLTCVPEEGVATSHFLCFYLLSKEGLEQVQAASPGSADRNRTLAMKRLEKIQVPVPDYDAQLQFNALQAKVAAIRQAQADNQTELDALLPSILDRAFAGAL